MPRLRVERLREGSPAHAGLETTPFAETVYDPFVGSGTTIIAAERQGRACWARYVDASVKRWEDYTGGQARRE